jgi:pyrimidine operon attenuation protein/uracil phosphoribosyltransferase
MGTKIEIFNKSQIKRVIHRLAFEVMERHGECDDLILMGIYRRGVFLAERLKRVLEENIKKKLPLGKLDINFYRDDWTSLKNHPIINKTEIDVDINGKKILLVDDVIYTGRTIRAALEAIMDYGRAAKVELLVLIDRGHRELPIHPDYCGKKIDTSKKEYVDVMLEEIDEKDCVVLYKR